jgi:hypothetical protein
MPDPCGRIVVRNWIATLRSSDISVLDYVRNCLTFPEIAFGTGGWRGYDFRRQHWCLWRAGSHGGLLIPAGLAETVREALLARHVRMRLVDRRRFDEHFAPNRGLAACKLPGEARLLDAAADSRGGLIEVPNENMAHAAVVSLCRLYPSARIAIAVDKRAPRERLMDRLEVCLFPRPVFTQGTWNWQARGCMVCQSGRLKMLRPEDIDIVILTDATIALAPTYCDGLRTLASRCMLFGLLPVEARLTRRELMTLVGHFGPKIVRCAQPRPGPDAVRVVWCDGVTSASVEAANTLERKRAAIWYNEARNNLIASIAQAVASPGADELTQQASLAGCRDVLASLGNSRRTIILVETTEHARVLAARLPGWQVRHAQPGQVSGGWGGYTLDPERRSGVPLDKLIVTLAYAKPMSDLMADVLIRADGTKWPLALPGFPPSTASRDRPALVLDIADSQDTEAATWTRRRRQAYRHCGWHCASATMSTGSPSPPATEGRVTSASS